MNLAFEAAVKSPFINSGEGTSSQHHSQRSFATKPSSKMQLGSVAKSQLTVNKQVKPDLNSDPVRAAAVAAGARIATQSDAASLLRAAQAKNAVHIMPTAGSSIKSALPSNASSSHTEAHSNVSLNGHPALSPSSLRPNLEKASSQSTQHNPISGTAMHIVSSSYAHTNNEVASKQDIVHSGGTKNVGKVLEEEDRFCVAGKESSKHVKQEKAVLLKQETKSKNADCSLKTEIVHQKQSVGESLKGSPKIEMGEGSDTSNGDKMDCSPVEKDEKQCAGQGEGENKGNVVRLVADKCGEKKEPGNALTGDDS